MGKFKTIENQFLNKPKSDLEFYKLGIEKNSILTLVFSFLLSIQAYSQTYTLPDTNFRNKLLVNYPTFMTGKQLNIAAATAYPGALVLSSANISDLTGIQYFPNIFSLDVSSNKLTTLPGISMLTNLINLYVQNNALVILPSLTSLTHLMDLQFYNNQLTQFPTITGLNNLWNIYAYQNKIKTIPNLSSFTNLQILHVSQNQLDSLPDLSALTSLKQLHCDNNYLTQIKGLQNLKQLQIIYCWNNQLVDLSGLSNNTTLSVFYAAANNITTLPNLNNKPFLTTVDIQVNQLTFSDLVPIHFVNTVASFFYNAQDSVGIFNSITKTEQQPLQLNTPVDQTISGNWFYWYKNNVLLDSNQIGYYSIPSVALTDSGTYTLNIKNPAFPQLILNSRPWRVHTKHLLDTVGTDSVLVKREKDILSLQSPIISSQSTTKYIWYKNGTAIDSNQTGKFLLHSVALGDSGVYRVKITFQGFPWLTQYSRRWTVKTLPCLNLYTPNVNITQNDCSLGIALELNPLSIGGNNLPYSYAMLRSDKTDTTFQQTSSFNGLLPGKYAFIVKDAKNCQIFQTVQLPKNLECEAVFSPDGNNALTSYYISEQGNAQIIDLKGNVIKEITSPGYWDGTKSDHSYADTGYYAVVVNNKKVANVTLVR